MNEFEDKIKKLLDLGLDIDLIYAYFLSRDKGFDRLLNELLELNYLNRLLTVNQLLKRESPDGEIVLGVLLEDPSKLISLSRDVINQHLLIVARSGFGKTTLLEGIASQMVEYGIPFTLFDFKREFRSLGVEYDEVIVFKRGWFKINILSPPPNVPLVVWEGYLSDLFAYNYGWYHGSRNLFQEYLGEVYDKLGRKATFYDLYEHVLKAKRKYRRDYYEVVLNRLYSISRNLSDFLSKNSTVNIPRILDSYVIIEVDGVPRAEQNLIIEYLLLWTYLYRLFNHGITNRLKHVFIFDEAKRVFDVTKEERGTTHELGIHLLSIIADEIRGFGEGLVISDQEPSKLSRSILANTAVKIVGNLGRGEDIEIIRDSMFIDEEHTKLIDRLHKGFWMLKISGYNDEPVIFKTEPRIFRRYISDEELKNKKYGLIKTFYISLDPSPELFETYILNDIIENPHLNLGERSRKWGLSYRDFKIYIENLKVKGLIEEVDMVFGVGRPMKFYVPSYKSFSKVGCRAKGGKVHRLSILMIHKLYSSLGFKCICEYRYGDYYVDLVCRRGNVKLAFEIVKSHDVDINKIHWLKDNFDLNFILLETESFPVYDFSTKTIYYDLNRFLFKVRDRLIGMNIGLNVS